MHNFITFIKSMKECFGVNYFNDQKVTRLQKIMANLPEKAYEDIENLILDEYQRAPTPKQIKEHVDNWKKSNLKNNNQVLELPRQLDCYDCYETGFMFCRVRFDPEELIMFCHCKYGDEKKEDRLDWQMPKYELSFAREIEKLKFKVDMFIPKKENEINFLSSESFEIINTWKCLVAQKEQRWKERFLNVKT